MLVLLHVLLYAAHFAKIVLLHFSLSGQTRRWIGKSFMYNFLRLNLPVDTGSFWVLVQLAKRAVSSRQTQTGHRRERSMMHCTFQTNPIWRCQAQINRATRPSTSENNVEDRLSPRLGRTTVCCSPVLAVRKISK